jgi:hypothetical protein
MRGWSSQGLIVTESNLPITYLSFVSRGMRLFRAVLRGALPTRLQVAACWWPHFPKLIAVVSSIGFCIGTSGKICRHRQILCFASAVTRPAVASELQTGFGIATGATPLAWTELCLRNHRRSGDPVPNVRPFGMLLVVVVR